MKNGKWEDKKLHKCIKIWTIMLFFCNFCWHLCVQRAGKHHLVIVYLGADTSLLGDFAIVAIWKFVSNEMKNGLTSSKMDSLWIYSQSLSSFRLSERRECQPVIVLSGLCHCRQHQAALFIKGTS